jgi:serine/threonine protein kinase
MHRDIKLENILFKKKKFIKIIYFYISSFDSLVIADFGLATYVNNTPFLFSRCGTPGYVAPEILKSKDVNSTYGSICDVFSAGSIFHYL